MIKNQCFNTLNIKYIRGVISNFEQHTLAVLYVI